MNETKQITIEDFVTSLFQFAETSLNPECNTVNENNAYLIFMLLLPAVELMGKTINQNEKNWNVRNTQFDISNAINELTSLEAYKDKLGTTDKVKNQAVARNDARSNQQSTRYVRKNLLCDTRNGLLHSCMLKGEISIRLDKNDLDNKIIGVRDFFNDLKKAWQEVENKYPVLQGQVGSKSNILIVVDDKATSGSTQNC